ncbi:MAG: bifunctional UDP-N-acetylmuramoyl-tripeptide:D-alanyl-D-alanine ligase/alanine racemase [Bacteroidetes bacterium]|nr:MAG: bifunctional UDP-N-acetylmuramoyl-tripeptide:D-alanyl-D-alanine ligase/alanine racemase [Bacteroidota bacterium]REK05320.1 MAG: bifunctional UDP-N-acetylmuramoyl-tripeptide:D-alanyl-D-alanine ligase/alanine racemase [Bacteroidota bacterium]REK36388.1 MAG: bifunctional UDP-N-acetylmuramoyl-tripeptide:D-alanyl-D-alanine ligase/alanine racemase [Bacteroidota bacterium]REK51133.1 MAG: bifunctional UDP-N-acetylmuramoyl-tripeptide:D-alanyl-D-alanine ligase/alanine racemase [Bacteroidota bacter
MDMQSYSVNEIAGILNAELINRDPGHSKVIELLTDSRKLIHAETSLFFAISGDRNDGHKFIEKLFEQGVRNFVISVRGSYSEKLPANFLCVNDTLEALQKLGAYHRKRFNIPVIGITGSNGKTIVKEWLYQLLRPDFNIVRSPRSFNSQTGVPLSVWQMNNEHQLAVIEAGISMPGEMKKLEEIVKPSIGIFTNIGSAHDENFDNIVQKVEEKMCLFSEVSTLIYSKDYPEIHAAVESLQLIHPGLKTFAWSRKGPADLQIGRVTKREDECEIQAVYKNSFRNITIPFLDDASVENSISCWCLMLMMEIEDEVIADRMLYLSPVAMRLEMKNGINNCSVINDSYNSDIGSLRVALDFLNQQKQHDVRTVILSDILQSGKNESALYTEVAGLLKAKNVDKLIGIGEAISRQGHLFDLNKSFYKGTDEFLKDVSAPGFRDETILIKGARPFGFEKISKFLQQKAHETTLEINLNALVHNLNFYRSRLRAGTKIMAMVKAASYGSGSFEIANTLQFHHVDYLAVAYTDEGVELRKAGISMPVMVMNPEIQSLESFLKYNLQPEIYNFRLLGQYCDELNSQGKGELRLHLKLDTGMHRLGFEEPEINQLIVRLKNNRFIRVESVFTHLAASDEAEHDGFTRIQIDRFKRMSDVICSSFDYPVLRHVLNSSGILRFNEAQFDMVRLGIGLYGVSSSQSEQTHLDQVATLRTTISQIKHVNANETVGYSRMGKLKRDSIIATVAVGYADGIDRRLGNGTGKMLVNGKLAPVVGNVCMDMTMLDITDIPAREGDEVLVFGTELPVTEMAKALGTIPYEVLSRISQRVKRVYFQE